jgi:protein TonB
MRNVSIYGQKWLDLVFEGKNKAYGAYQLRQESAQTTGKAFVCGVALVGGIFFIMSSFSERTEPVIISEPIVVTHINTITEIPIDKPKQPETKAPKAPKKPTETPPITNAPPVVVATPLAQPEVPTNVQAAAAPTTTGSPTGTAPSTGTNTAGSAPPTTIPASTGPVKASELDRQPNFPGGIQNFYQYVANNFDRENLDEGETIRVNVSFVIETDGTMTNIEVKEKTNTVIANEAIRVLKSLKKKWTPGIKNGQAVRTQFTLPIAVLL